MTIEHATTQISSFSQPPITSELFSDQALLSNIFNQCYTPKLSLVNHKWLKIFKSDEFNQNILNQLQALGFTNTLEDIFNFPPNATPFEKVYKITCTIHNNTNKPISNLVENYKDFYYTNILRFFQQLPSGKDFLNSEEIRNLSDEEKVERFQNFLSNYPYYIRVLNLELINLAFLPLEINKLIYVEEIVLKYEPIQVIPEGLNLPNLKYIATNLVPKIPDKFYNIVSKLF